MIPSHQRIAVVMSTYNGENHLVEQIESILAQSDVQVELIVRDDGSVDGTVNLLEDYARVNKVRLVRGENKGVVGSFLDAIAAAPGDVPYIALSDQDDVWHADKLSRAMQIMDTKDNKIPQLYCSEYIFCDAEMHPQAPSHLNRIGVSFPTMLYENMVSGNTVVINRKLADLIINAGRDGVYTHDWWLGLVATALGELTYDTFASLDYRRTGSNASPTGTSAVNILKYRIKTFIKNDQFHDVTQQLHRLYELFSDAMAPDKRELLERFLYGGRFKKACTPIRLRQKLSEEFVLRLLFIAGTL